MSCFDKSRARKKTKRRTKMPGKEDGDKNDDGYSE
jgi:hypothetical protein